MTHFFQTVTAVFSAFGAGVFVPLILFCIALCMGVSYGRAFHTALLCAVGLTGFHLVIQSYSDLIAPVIQQMAEHTGLSLSVLDTGWQATSVIAYSTTVGLLFVGIAIFLQLILFFLKWTNVFMVSDLWNNYSFMVWGSLLYAITKHVFLALALMVTQLLYILLFSEVLAKRWSSYYAYENCCITAPHHLEGLPFAIVMNWLLGKLGLDRIQLNAHTLEKRLGVLGEPMFIGLFVGALIGIIGNFQDLLGSNRLSAWSSVTSVALSTAAIMAVFPKVAGIFASAFSSLTDAYKTRAIQSGKGRTWYLAVNDACGYGEPSTLVSGILLIPVMLLLAFLLPGNQILPMADLCALPYMVEVFVCVSHGNITKSILCGALWFSLGMLIASSLAPVFTQVALDAGFSLSETGVSIISFGIMCHPFMAGLFFVFLSCNPLLIGGVILLYFLLYFLFQKYRESILQFLEHPTDF